MLKELRDWWQRKHEPAVYRGIGMPLVDMRKCTLIRTPEDVRTVLDMVWRGTLYPDGKHYPSTDLSEDERQVNRAVHKKLYDDPYDPAKGETTREYVERLHREAEDELQMRSRK